jgi:signal transduction histidine kinase
VRAVSTSGKISAIPALATFTILPPIWQRWWFIALSAALVAGIVITLERLRVRRLLEIEKVRSRIATDLHDDIGAGLTHIGLLSEITRRQYQAQLAETGAPAVPNDGAAHHADIGSAIERMGGVARELSAAMSDVVWSINPRHDSLAALLYRLTNFATEICKAKNISLNFAVDEKLTKIKLNPEIRRSLLLIAKEALHNMAKYSGSPSVNVKIGSAGKEISVVVEDHGAGFDSGHTRRGNGLLNMRARAEKHGGKCEIVSAPGQGTCVTAIVPYRK